MSTVNVLIIFVKNPEAGFVKTRLADSIGGRSAAFLYSLFAEAVFARTEDSRYVRIVFYRPAERQKEIKAWVGKGIEIEPQEGDDLGSIMFNGFSLAFRKGAKRVIAIGTDSPLIDNETISKAFKALEDSRCVIGPSLDGGYYLLGLSRPHKGIFKKISWGTDRVFGETLDNLKKLKIKYDVLDTGIDIDRVEDLVGLKERLQKMDNKALKGLFPILEALEKILSCDRLTKTGVHEI